MDDWDGPDLGGLRADVDHDASRNLFDRRRRRRHQRRRAALGGGLAVLLAGVVAVTAVVVPDERVSVITDEAPEPDPGGEIGFELLADEGTDDKERGLLRSATDDASLAALWNELALEGPPPPVDFRERVVVSMTVADGACPAELAGFERSGDLVTPDFEEQPGDCPPPPVITRTYVAALDRDSVGRRFTVFLPGRADFGYGDQGLLVEVPEVVLEVVFEVLARREAAGDAPGQLRSATSGYELAAMWAAIGFPAPLPKVDLARQLVVSITIPDDACPPALTGFEHSGETVTPTFVEPAGPCREPLIPKTYVVAIDRATVSPTVTLALEPPYGRQRLVVQARPGPAPSGRSEVIVELVDIPSFIEGFDYAVRFTGPGGEVLDERRRDAFQGAGDADFPTDVGSAVTWFRLAPGPVTVESHLTVGGGAGPGRPDFETESEGGLCPPAILDLDAGERLFLTLDWDDGCLVEDEVGTVRAYFRAVELGDQGLALSHVTEGFRERFERPTRELVDARERTAVDVQADGKVRIAVTEGEPLRSFPPCTFSFSLIEAGGPKIDGRTSCSLPPPPG